MEVILVKPFGFCFGVKKAIEIAYKAKEENPEKTIYILGELVHNETVLNKLKEDGFALLNVDSRFFKDELLKMEDRAVIVFSAHGHSPKLDEIAKSKKMKVYDATCHFVKENERKIRDATNNGDDVIFVGIKKHAEAIASLSIDESKVHLYDRNEVFDFPKIKSKTPLVVSQTTMTNDEIDEAINDIKKNISEAKIAAKHCFATESRQKELVKLGKEADAFVVIGSKGSNNTRKLIQLVNDNFPNKKCLNVVDVDDLTKHIQELNGNDKILIASGASTPDYVVLECKKYLLSII